MKRIARSLVVLTVLLAIAQPTFACIFCDFDGQCRQGSGARCKFLIDDGCIGGQLCFTAPVEPLAAELRIASVEISHESDVKVAEAPKPDETIATAAIAEAKVDRIRK